MGHDLALTLCSVTFDGAGKKNKKNKSNLSLTPKTYTPAPLP